MPTAAPRLRRSSARPCHALLGGSGRPRELKLTHAFSIQACKTSPERGRHRDKPRSLRVPSSLLSRVSVNCRRDAAFPSRVQSFLLKHSVLLKNHTQETGVNTTSYPTCGPHSVSPETSLLAKRCPNPAVPTGLCVFNRGGPVRTVLQDNGRVIGWQPVAFWVPLEGGLHHRGRAVPSVIVSRGTWGPFVPLLVTKL